MQATSTQENTWGLNMNIYSEQFKDGLCNIRSLNIKRSSKLNLTSFEQSGSNETDTKQKPESNKAF